MRPYERAPYCRKVRYRDRVGALTALAKLERQDKPDHTEQRPYRCPTCRGWHLTSLPQVDWTRQKGGQS